MARSYGMTSCRPICLLPKSFRKRRVTETDNGARDANSKFDISSCCWRLKQLKKMRPVSIWRRKRRCCTNSPKTFRRNLALRGNGELCVVYYAISLTKCCQVEGEEREKDDARLFPPLINDISSTESLSPARFLARVGCDQWEKRRLSIIIIIVVEDPIGSSRKRSKPRNRFTGIGILVPSKFQRKNNEVGFYWSFPLLPMQGNSSLSVWHQIWAISRRRWWSWDFLHQGSWFTEGRWIWLMRQQLRGMRILSLVPGEVDRQFCTL